MKGSIEIREPHLFVVEGEDDRRFLEAFIRAEGLGHVQILATTGKDNIRGFLGSLRRTPGFRKLVTSLGILRDADDDPKAAFQSVRDALAAAELPFPDQPSRVAAGPPRVAVMIIPGGGGTGALEDLCLRAVYHDPLMRCVEQYIDCLNAAGSRPGGPSKARVQAFLASRPRAGLRLGEAAEAGYWNFQSEVYDQLRGFLRSLVE